MERMLLSVEYSMEKGWRERVRMLKTFCSGRQKVGSRSGRTLSPAHIAPRLPPNTDIIDIAKFGAG